MAHFALLDDNGIVQNIVLVSNEDLVDENGEESEATGIAFCERVIGPGPWVQTSRNTRYGVHLDPDTFEPDGGVPLRANFAEIGYKYYAELDIFAPAERPFDVPEWFELNLDGYWSCPVGLDPDTGQPLTPEQWEFLEVVFSQPTAVLNPDVRI
jgi:hypothetical protein